MFNSGTKAKYPKKYFTCNDTTQVARLRISKFLTVALPSFPFIDFAFKLFIFLLVLPSNKYCCEIHFYHLLTFRIRHRKSSQPSER